MRDFGVIHGMIADVMNGWVKLVIAALYIVLQLSVARFGSQ